MPYLTAEDRIALAREAHEGSQSLLGAGKLEQARRWADRAARLLPHDDTLALTHATLLLRLDPERAAGLFARLAARHDLREVWAGLTIARRTLGDFHGAAAALQQALSHHVPDGSLTSLADTLVRQLNLPGWCGLTRAGVLKVELAGHRTAELAIDGQVRRRLASGATRLPRAWFAAAHSLSIMADGVQLLGSPIQAARLRRVEGCVSSRDGGIEGWAWHPADPTAVPIVQLRSNAGTFLVLAAREAIVADDYGTPLARPRRFAVDARRLAGMAGPIHVRGDDGQDLLGSPLDPTQEQRDAAAVARGIGAALAGKSTPGARHAPLRSVAIQADIKGPSPPIGASRHRRIADVVIPVHDGGAVTRACIASVLATVARPSRIVVVDDATRDPELVAALDALARGRRILLIRHAHSLGYPASANAGIRACAGRDVVLLNSDTLVPPQWLERLRAAAYAASDIGTAAPLSNNATILSYPRAGDTNPMPDADGTALLAALAHRVNGGAVADIPVSVGFCLYLRRDCLAAVGPLREDVFAQGYGEENDFCLRARHLGWHHVAAPGVFVAHHGAQSFGAAAAALRARNQRLLDRLHPGYGDLIRAHVRDDTLAAARRRLDLARWRAVRPALPEAVLLVTHAEGGGVERCVAASCARHRAAGLRPVVLRPVTLLDNMVGIGLSDGTDDDFPNLRFALPAEAAAAAAFLRSTRPRAIELHHALGHNPAVLDLIQRLALPYDLRVHDYLLLCPRVTLVGRERRYCGEPDVASCETCIADLGTYAEEAITVAALRDRSRRLLAGARRVLVPSDDAAARLRRYFPTVRSQVVPHEDDAELAAVPLTSVARHQRARVCVIGAIGVDKGLDVLLACARDAASRDLPLEFVLVGHSTDDRRLLDTGRVFVTGEFKPEEAVSLIREQNADVAWLPSVWPETWCFTLSEAWRAGLRVVAFDLGAQAERIRRGGRGTLLPLGLPPAAVNSALLAAAGLPAQR